MTQRQEDYVRAHVIGISLLAFMVITGLIDIFLIFTNPRLNHYYGLLIIAPYALFGWVVKNEWWKSVRWNPRYQLDFTYNFNNPEPDGHKRAVIKYAEGNGMTFITQSRDVLHSRVCFLYLDEYMQVRLRFSLPVVNREDL